MMLWRSLLYLGLILACTSGAVALTGNRLAALQLAILALTAVVAAGVVQRDE
jgi:hypothetical protein